jgi:hypothetical protein
MPDMKDLLLRDLANGRRSVEDLQKILDTNDWLVARGAATGDEDHVVVIRAALAEYQQDEDK